MTRFITLSRCLLSVIWLAVIAVALSAVGCGSGNSGAAGGKPNDNKRIRICVLPKRKGIAYFSSCAEGAKEAAKELGNVELIYDGPIKGDARKQAEMIEQWTTEGVDVICVSPNAPKVVAAAMKDARAAGIQVITWDADALVESRDFFVNQATPKSIAEGMVNAMVNDLKELDGKEPTGEVVIVSSDATAANQNSWIDLMKPALAATKLKLATIKYPGEDSADALGDAQDVIKKYKNLRGIFGISSISFPAAAEAVDQSGNTGKILVTGLSTPNIMKNYVKKGTVKSVILWNTVDLGYLTVHVAEGLATGKLTKSNTTFKAGRLGELKVEGDQVILGDILRFNQKNIDQYDF